MKWLLKRLAAAAGYRTFSAEHAARLCYLGAYGIPLVAFLERTLRDRAAVRVCFDVGANIGQTASSFAKFFPAARIHCFEPSRATYAQLVENVSVCPRITAHNVALGSKNSTATLYLPGDSQQASLIADDGTAPSGRTEQVAVRTLTDFAREQAIVRIDILKTDAEGFDLEVLRGAGGMLDSGKIDLIYTEVGFGRRDHSHTYLPSVLEYLEERDYFFVGLFETVYWQDPPRAGYGNALFSHRQAQLLGAWK